jgi:hypothetical protein
MAIWQFSVEVIPREAVLENYGEVPKQLFIDKAAWQKFRDSITPDNPFDKPDFEDAFTIEWWENSKINKSDIFPFLDIYLERTEWGDGQKSQHWGNSQTNDVGIYLHEESGRIIDFGFRIDLRADFTQFLATMLKLCESLDCLIMDKRGNIAEPIFDTICDLINDSNPDKFVRNPRKFIEDFSSGKIKPE